MRSNTLSRAETWSEEERTRIWWLKIGATIAVVLCWIGAFACAANSPFWIDGTINWSLFEAIRTFGRRVDPGHRPADARDRVLAQDPSARLGRRRGTKRINVLDELFALACCNMVKACDWVVKDGWANLLS